MKILGYLVIFSLMFIMTGISSASSDIGYTKSTENAKVFSSKVDNLVKNEKSEVVERSGSPDNDSIFNFITQLKTNSQSPPMNYADNRTIGNSYNALEVSNVIRLLPT